MKLIFKVYLTLSKQVISGLTSNYFGHHRHFFIIKIISICYYAYSLDEYEMNLINSRYKSYIHTLWSIIKPRNVFLCTHCRLLNIMNFVLVKLNDNLLSSNHFLRLLILFSLYSEAVSAIFNILDTLLISYSLGPSTEPCGTPQVTFFRSDLTLFICTN